MKDLGQFSILRHDYQKDNFDRFLKAIHFDFSIPAIHIAGTNGKGSTATYIANIYRASGLKVGLYTSPYLLDINELINIDGNCINDEELSKFLKNYEKDFKKFNLSEFEITTFIAFTYFKEQHCDLCVIECGMGGEYDATNIFTPVLSIITSISIEHSIYLGDTLTEIAMHKAGIIKKNVPALIGHIYEEAENTIVDVCMEQHSTLTKTTDTYDLELVDDGLSFSYGNYHGLKITSCAEYSTRGAALAIEATKILTDKFPISEANIYDGLANTYMPARFEKMQDNPTVIVDGAHNPEAITKLVNEIEKMNFGRNIHVVFASFKDKNIVTMLPTLAYLSDDICLTYFDHPRTRSEEDYFLFLDEYKYDKNHKQVIKNLIANYPDDVILITGSLAFAGIVRKEFKDGQYK